MGNQTRVAIRTDGAPNPPHFFSQGLIVTRKLGSCDLFRIERYAVINDIFFSFFFFLYFELTQAQRQILQDLMGVLEAAGSSLKDVNIFLTDMEDFTWVNEISDTYFCDPKPASKLTHSLIPAFFFNEGFI
jgi:hypothetical protein